jgi:hypothetical protein
MNFTMAKHTSISIATTNAITSKSTTSPSSINQSCVLLRAIWFNGPDRLRMSSASSWIGSHDLRRGPAATASSRGRATMRRCPNPLSQFGTASPSKFMLERHADDIKRPSLGVRFGVTAGRREDARRGTPVVLSQEP